MNVFIHKNRTLWEGFHLMGMILIAVAAALLLFYLFSDFPTDQDTLATLVGALLLFGLIAVSSYSGTVLDFEHHRYKSFQNLLWIKLGSWKTLPEIDHAEMIIHTFRSENFRNGITPTLSSETTVYKCVLLSGGTKFLAFDFAKEKDAIRALLEIKQRLGL